MKVRLLRLGALLGWLAGVVPSLSAQMVGQDLEVAKLRSEVAFLKQLATNDLVTINQLKAENEVLAGAASARHVSLDAAAGAHLVLQSPSSGLAWPEALRTALAARLMVEGSSLLTVMPTGSMEPMFNERAILLVEPAKFEDLKVGDVVIYQHPRYASVVVHRLVGKRVEGFVSQGDNNGRPDSVVITKENYHGRIFGIIYARGPAQAGSTANTSFAASP